MFGQVTMLKAETFCSTPRTLQFSNRNDHLFSLSISEGAIHREYEIETLPNGIIEKRCLCGQNITI